jgi:transcriptional regulator GlxA family with amidase domain
MSTAPKPKLAAVQPLGSRMSERHFSPAELAELWNLSEDTIRRAFEAEPDVLIFENPSRNPNRRRRTLRIPESVAERVYRRLSTRLDKRMPIGV